MSKQGTINPEYIPRRCKQCGTYYTSAGNFIEVGLCETCAKATGWYCTPRTK